MKEITKTARAGDTDGARVIDVIETKSLRGDGTEENPYRKVVRYWDLTGRLLAENDPEITGFMIMNDK